MRVKDEKRLSGDALILKRRPFLKPLSFIIKYFYNKYDHFMIFFTTGIKPGWF